MALRIAVGLVSAAILGYEILLLRFFSITYWHHFALMIISLALLGFGASGTVIALARKWLSKRLTPAFVAAATLFGISALGALVVTKSVPYNPLELVWDVRQPVYLTLHYLVLAVPFLCGGFAIGLALSCNRAELHRIYRYDLIGAGAGAVAVMLALSTLPLEYCFKLTGLAGFAAAGVAAVGLARLRVVAFAAIAALAAAATAIPGAWLQPTRSGPLGVVTAVASPDVPFRHAPGLSLNAPQVPTEQIALFTDGDGLSPITRFENDFEELRYLDFMPMSLPYHLVRQPRVLVLGAGGGSDVLLARYHGARSIDAVELSPEIVELVRGPFAGYAGHLFDAPNTTIHVAEARHFAATTDQRFELIQISLLDSFNAASAGVHALNESGLYTVEALSIFYGRLAPTGMLAITRWLKLPPRDGLRLFATALEVLRRQNIADPARRLALVRSWNTVTLLMARAPIDAEQIASVRRFAEQRGYDIAYLPGMVSADANRFNLLPEPYFFAGARALLGDSRRRFLDAYKFDVRPITDDRPYFFHFFKWRLLPELIASPGRAGVPLIEMGYVVLFATLVQAALVAAILILLLLALGRRNRVATSTAETIRVLVYFAAVGLVFLLVEIALIQRFSLFLGHPIYAVTLVLASMLVFAGIGSGFADRLERALGRHPPAVIAAATVAVMVGSYLVILPHALSVLTGTADTARFGAAIALIAPLAFVMGLPFPLGLRCIASRDEFLVPWAWGVNGCASVLSVISATLLGIHFGFGFVLLLAALLYGVAAFSRLTPARLPVGDGTPPAG